MVALALIAIAARAEASGARLRWAASVDTRTTGYRVYVRRAGTAYGSAIDVGKPAAATDGSISYTVSNLTAGQTYYFAVTAYAPGPIESGFSGEMVLGATNPCMVDRCVSPTACDIHVAADGSSCDDGLFCNGIAVCQSGSCQQGVAPNCSDGVACTTDRCDETLARCVHTAQAGCCASDADCADTDACTLGEYCDNGTCRSYDAICPGSPCADGYCDPRSGCKVKPTPDGVSCPESCGPLEVRRLIVNAAADGATLNLRSSFATPSFVDPSLNGFSIEVLDGIGAVAYRATVPAYSITSRNEGTKFRYLASSSESQQTDGIYGLVLRKRQDKWVLHVRAESPDLSDALTYMQLGATVRVGDVCARNTTMICTSDGERTKCK